MKIEKLSGNEISNLLDSYNEFDTKKILFYENSNPDNLVIKNLNKFKKILVVVGPEGGFSENEIHHIMQKE